VACRGLDAQVVRPDDPELAQLLNQFEPVRITNFRGVDMNRFRFDYDLTFAALMMDPDGTVYSRFGARDAQSETARLSIAGLKRAMKAVLALAQARSRHPAPAAMKPFTLADIPAYRDSPQAKAECAHCHFANNFRFRQLRLEAKFSKDLLFQYPLPENLGITLEVDRNNVVAATAPGSPAAAAGIRPGDVILRAGEIPVLTGADVQFALNSAPDPGSISLEIQRTGKPFAPVTLSLPRGWRRTDISWRASQDSIPPTVGFWGEPLDASQREQRSIPAGKLALRVTHFFSGEKWAKTRGGLQMQDVITGINGESLPEMSARQFHSYFRLRFNVGDSATLNILRGSERIELTVPCLEAE